MAANHKLQLRDLPLNRRIMHKIDYPLNTVTTVESKQRSVISFDHSQSQSVSLQ